MSFHVAPGRILGIAGPSGAGKTTLLRILAGAAAPSSGHARLDGADLASLSEADRRAFVGYLPQSVDLLPGTVRENVARMGEAEDAAVVEAAALAGAHEAILALPEGYETRVGPGGALLPGGAAQQIGLARALFGRPAFLVLDEPNAHLDARGEAALLAALAKVRERGATVVLVSPRTRVLSRADALLVLDGGRAAAFGPREEVLRKLRPPPLRAVPS